MQKKILLCIGLLIMQGQTYSMFQKIINHPSTQNPLVKKAIEIYIDPRIILARTIGRVGVIYYGYKATRNALEKIQIDADNLKQAEINQLLALEMEKLRQRNSTIKSSLLTTLALTSLFGSYLYYFNK